MRKIQGLAQLPAWEFSSLPRTGCDHSCLPLLGEAIFQFEKQVGKSQDCGFGGIWPCRILAPVILVSCSIQVHKRTLAPSS